MAGGDNIRKIGVLLLSGGLDSTTVAAYALHQGYELKALTFRYGQKHAREVECAARVARVLGIDHRVADISSFGKLAWYSALTSPEAQAVPAGRDIPGMAEKIPATYVPLRNTLFISMAAAYLESEALDLIEVRGVAPHDLDASLFIAANAVDYSGYPDCRPEYYRQMTRTIALGSKLGATYGKAIRIQTPIISRTKAEIVKLAVALRAPLQYTWSCYQGGERPCGECDSCLLRARGFAEAGLADPALPER